MAKKPKNEQRPIYIDLAVFKRLQQAYHRAAIFATTRRTGKALLKSEFYTQIIEKGLKKGDQTAN